MSRKIFSAALALTVAGGVYLAGAPAEASNMGFKLERSFDLTRDPSGRAYLNLYLVSYPGFNGLGDVANTAWTTTTNKCVGDTTTTPPGPTAGDGIINAHDATCDAWTTRQGTFVFQRFDRDTCRYEASTATVGPFGIAFTGTAFPIQADLGIGYEVLISSSSPTVSPQNRAVIVGSHDPSFTGRPVVAVPPPGCAPTAARLDIWALPYHTMFTRANEMLCGLEGVDWVDVAAPIGSPDTCPDGNVAGNEGIPFDGAHTLAIQTYDNEVAHGYVARTVTFNPIAGLAFTGTNFALRPGDAYIAVINPAQEAGATFLSPHF